MKKETPEEQIANELARLMDIHYKNNSNGSHFASGFALGAEFVIKLSRKEVIDKAIEEINKKIKDCEQDELVGLTTAKGILSELLINR